MSLVFAKGCPRFARDGSLNEEQGSWGHLDKVFVGSGLGAVFLGLGSMDHICAWQGLCSSPWEGSEAGHHQQCAHRQMC